MSIEGKKYDAGKLRWLLLPFEALEIVIHVLMLGASRYGDYNWQHVPNGKQRYTEAAFRHLVAYSKGQIYDPKDHYHHLACVICNCLFVLTFDLESGLPGRSRQADIEEPT